VKELSKARDDWQVIQQARGAIVDLEQQLFYSKQVLDQSAELLRILDKIGSPLIRAPEDGVARLDSPRDLASPLNNRVWLMRHLRKQDSR
jgi:hypothetical protein